MTEANTQPSKAKINSSYGSTQWAIPEKNQTGGEMD